MSPENEIRINSIPIKRVTYVKFLGIIIAEPLTWQAHIDLVKILLKGLE